MLSQFGFFERVHPLFAAAIVVGMAIFVFFAVNQTHEAREIELRQFYEARDLWLSDCAAMKRPIDDCTMSWSKNYLLRDVYVEKTGP